MIYPWSTPRKEVVGAIASPATSSYPLPRYQRYETVPGCADKQDRIGRGKERLRPRSAGNGISIYRGQILAYATMTDRNGRLMKLFEIAANPQVPVSNYSSVINKVKWKAIETGNLDLWVAENLAT